MQVMLLLGGVVSLDKVTCNTLNTAPTATGLTVTPATDGSGEVTIQVTLDDEDDDDTLQFGITYDDGGGDADPTLSTVGG